MGLASVSLWLSSLLTSNLHRHMTVLYLKSLGIANSSIIFGVSLFLYEVCNFLLLVIHSEFSYLWDSNVYCCVYL